MIDLKKYQNKIIAHRGIHNNKEIPENSLKSFNLALKENLPIELDIHLTKDNQLVVFHDDNLKRMTGKDIIIETQTLAQLKEYRLLNTNETIPTLDEVLKLINGKVLIDIEVKAKRQIKDLTKLLLKNLEKYNGEIIIKSFNPNVVKELKKKTNKYQVGLLISTNTNDKTFNFLSKTNFFIFYSKPDFLAISKKMLKRKNFQKHLTKYPILIWTIKEPNEILEINNKTYIYISNILPFKKD